MDTTKKYILMCEKAKKWLSPFYKGKAGDLYVGKDHRMRMVNSNIITDGILHPDCSPVFRQDQLQEILDKPKKWANSPFDMLCSIYDFSQDWVGGGAETMGLNHFGEYLEKLSSAEQVWLAFVMKEKWNKEWSEKDWVKSK